MYHFRDLTGRRFGKLYVIKQDTERTKSGGLKWLCVCDCGTTKSMSSSNITRRLNTGCGCGRGKTITLKLDREDALFKALYRQYRNSAKTRKIKFDLSVSEFESLIYSDCYYCGAEPQQKFSGYSLSYLAKYVNNPILYNGIDRVNNKKGYILENCLPCCWFCNRAKGDSSYEEFMEWRTRIAYFTLY